MKISRNVLFGLKLCMMLVGVCVPLVLTYACTVNFDPNPCWFYTCMTNCEDERAQAKKVCESEGGDLDPLATCVTTMCGCTKLSTTKCVEDGDGQFDIEGDAFEFEGL